MMANECRRLPAPRPGWAKAQTLAIALLAGVSAFALLIVALTLTNWPETDAASDRDAALVRGFYAAANDILAGADVAALGSFIASSAVAHENGGTASGEAAFASRLTRLRAASPGLQFNLDAVAIAGDRATVALSLAGADDRFLGIPLPDRPPVQPLLERFRLANGRIAEYWPSTVDDGARTLPPLPLPLESGETRVGLARFTYPPGGDLATSAAPGPELLIGEIGAVSITLSEPASWSSANAPEAGWRTAAAGVPLVLGAGDALLIPPGAGREIRNASASPATTLGVLTYRQPRVTRRGYEGTPDGPAYLIMYDPARIGRPAPWGRDVVVDILASGITSGPDARQATLAVGWLPLGRGQSIPAHPVPGVELVAVASGALLVAGPQSGSPASTIAAPASVPAVLAPPPERRLLLGGDAAAFSAGISAPVDQAGEGTARALLVVIAPSPAKSPPTPEAATPAKAA